MTDKSSKTAKAKPNVAKTALPLALSPQLATLVDAPPRGDGWIYELKFDGYRLLARIDGDDVRLFTRNGNDWTSRLKSLGDEVRSLGIPSGWIDGEIVVMNARGVPDFQALQGAFDSAKTNGIVYFVFDLPHFDGHDLTRVPLVERRKLLEKIMESSQSARIRFSEAFEAPVAKLLASACEKGLEGLIGKRADAPYASTRSASWVKLKCTQRQEFVVGGYTDPKASRSGFGALLLGVHDAEGRLAYAGSVGTGFDDALLRSLAAKLKALATDKDPQAITRERAAHAAKPTVVAKPAGTKITNPERVIDARSRATKFDLVQYYERIAPHMLPHLAGRPVSLLRAPKGVGGEIFFQKHGEKLSIPGIVHLDRKYWPGHEPMLEVASAEALVGAAQMNVIELHTWNSTTADISHPDRVIFDLDPGEGIGWETVKEATALTKKMLDLLGLGSFLKTSGGKGLHVVVPLTPRWDYDRVKDFSERMVQHMAATIPKLFVAKSGARNRVGRIFVDYLRNGKGATTVAAFSARARPGLGVSVPVTWKELPRLAAADQWNIANVDQRMAKLRADPWKDYWTTKQTLEKAAKKLG